MAAAAAIAAGIIVYNRSSSAPTGAGCRSTSPHVPESYLGVYYADRTRARAPG